MPNITLTLSTDAARLLEAALWQHAGDHIPTADREHCQVWAETIRAMVRKAERDAAAVTAAAAAQRQEEIDRNSRIHHSGTGGYAVWRTAGKGAFVGVCNHREGYRWETSLLSLAGAEALARDMCRKAERDPDAYRVVPLPTTAL